MPRPGTDSSASCHLRTRPRLRCAGARDARARSRERRRWRKALFHEKADWGQTILDPAFWQRVFFFDLGEVWLQVGVLRASELRCWMLVLAGENEMRKDEEWINYRAGWFGGECIVLHIWIVRGDSIPRRVVTSRFASHPPRVITQ